MQNIRFIAAATLFSATIALSGCAGDNPAQSFTPTSGGSSGGGAAVSPFDDIALGAASLQQAAGMAAGAKSPALTTVAPLQQAGAGYRVGAISPTTLPANDWEDEGLFSTYFRYTRAEQGTDDKSGVDMYVTEATFTTYDQGEQNVESGTNIRALGYKKAKDDAGKDIYGIVVAESRRATTSTRRQPGTYALLGVAAVHDEVDYIQLSAAFTPLAGGASSSIDVVYYKLYKPTSYSGTFEQKLAHRGAQISEEFGIKGSLATGESLDLSAKRAGTDTAPTRTASGSVDLGGAKGKIVFSSDLKLSQTADVPSAVTGTVSIMRKDKANNAFGEILINSFTCRPLLREVETAGELRNPQGLKVGTFTGKIDLKANQWLGIYQQDSQATKSIDLSGLMDQLW